VLTGAEEQVHGLPTYVARPEPGVEPKAVVVIIPDAFGWKLKNTRALADNYARRAELLVYLPDFMNGMPPATDLH
jgi:dienelactone hydrolase